MPAEIQTVTRGPQMSAVSPPMAGPRPAPVSTAAWYSAITRPRVAGVEMSAQTMAATVM